MKKIYFLCVAIATATVTSAQTTITQWNFDNSSNSATTGSGTATVVAASGNPSFPAGSPSSGKSWSVSGFPSQGTASGTAGFAFAASTAGYTGITVSVDMAGSNTGSRYYQMQYTVNGSEWTNIGTVSAIGPTSAWSTISNAIPADANNNADFAFRVVSVFDPANNNAYTAIGSASNYSTSGTARVDNVTISGTATTLSISDSHKIKYNFIKNTFVKNDEITFGVQAKNVKIYNMFGQEVKSTAVKENEVLNISGLGKGSYIVTGLVNNEPVSKRILKD